MLLLALQYWKEDYDQMMRLARRIADIEPAFRQDVAIEFVIRFDAPEPDPIIVAHLAKKFVVTKYRCKRRGRGHPAGCNDMVHDFIGKCWERTLREPKFKAVDGVWLYEADNVPLRKDWLNVMLSEWKEARAQGKLLLGCWHPDGSPVGHVNGNMIIVPDLFNRLPGMEGCPSFNAWDLFHAEKFAPHWAKSPSLCNIYRATEVPKSWLFDRKGKAKYVSCHGVKDDSAWALGLAIKV